MPKVVRSLPHSLTEEEVEALLRAPDVSDPLGNRDRTMIEVLYGSGLRVGELVNLRQGEVNLNQGVIRTLGKGDRERLVPPGWVQPQYARSRQAQVSRPPKTSGSRETAVAPTIKVGGPVTRLGRYISTHR
jgi:site-specific recombinase XerD